MPVSEVLNILQLISGEYGWLITTLIILYEVSFPSNIGPFELWDTQLQKTAYRLEEKIDELLETQTAIIQVTRALAREVEGVSEIEADRYLRENGIDVETFLISTDSEGGETAVSKEDLEDL